MVVLRDYIDKEDATIKIGAIMGLGIAYVGDNCQKYLIETCGFRQLSHLFSYLGLCYCTF